MWPNTQLGLCEAIIAGNLANHGLTASFNIGSFRVDLVFWTWDYFLHINLELKPRFIFLRLLYCFFWSLFFSFFGKSSSSGDSTSPLNPAAHDDLQGRVALRSMPNMSNMVCLDILQILHLWDQRTYSYFVCTHYLTIEKCTVEARTTTWWLLVVPAILLARTRLKNKGGTSQYKWHPRVICLDLDEKIIHSHQKADLRVYMCYFHLMIVINYM